MEGVIENTKENMTIWYYYETEEDNGFANAMIECICEENLNNKVEAEREDAIDRYYNNYD